MSQQLVLHRQDNTDGDLLSVLKALEVKKTLGAEPVLTALRHFPARPAQIEPFPDDLHPRLGEVLAARGLSGLYTHQREAYERVQEGRVTFAFAARELRYNNAVALKEFVDRTS